jgi:hypothetical protein
MRNAHGATHFPTHLIQELSRYADLWGPITQDKNQLFVGGDESARSGDH